MKKDTQTTEKRIWQAPEIIEVGRVVDVTEGGNSNVRDNGKEEPPTYWIKRAEWDTEEEVDLD